MPSTCYSILRVPAIRVTKLDACGAVVTTGTCSMATSSGIITIESTVEVEDRQDYFLMNADAEFCVKDTKPPTMKWVNLTLTFCGVDPELLNIITSEPIVLDDAATPVAVGLRTREQSINTSNFGFEAWTRIGGDCSTGVTNDVQYGYVLYPWVIEGMLTDLTLENAVANFIVTARTRYNSLWGVGPYNIRLAQSGLPANDPEPLLTAITSLDHRHLQLTTLGPPEVNCGCGDITPALTVVDPGAGLTADLTIPDSDLLPAIVDWGDLSTQVIAAGATSPVSHTYAGAATYNVTFKSQIHSAPTYTGSVVVA